MNLLIGADPEVFLKRGEDFYSGYGVIPGTKVNPFPVNKGAVQVDGMALEFNINPAASDEEFLININTVLDELKKMVPTGFDVTVSPVAMFSPEHMDEQPEEAKVLGCDPDFNAYTMTANPRPDQHPVMRTAAGHVHIGWTEDADVNDKAHFLSCCMLSKQLDAFLGVPSVLLDPDVERKKMYGRAGAFRPKSYGTEYRVLSNFWLKSPKLIKWVFNNTKLAVDKLMVGELMFEADEEYLKEIINRNNKIEAEHFCLSCDIPY